MPPTWSRAGSPARFAAADKHGRHGSACKKKRPLAGALPDSALTAVDLVVHPAHSPHAAHAAAAAAAHGSLGLGEVGDGALGGEEEGRDRGGVLESGARDLGRVDDAGLDHVHPLHLGGIEADALLLVFGAVRDDGAVDARVLGDLADGLLEGALGDLEADLLVVGHLGLVGLVEGEGGLDEGDTAAGDDAFLDRGAGGGQGVLHSVLLLLHLDLGRGADVDDGHAAGELGEALLELLAVVVAGGVLDLALDLRDAVLDVLLLAGAVDDGGVVLVHLDGLGGAQLGDGGVLELEPKLLGDDLFSALK